MSIIKGIVQHPIVLCMDKKDKAIQIQALLIKKGFKVTVTLNLYDAINAIAQEMPHLIIADSLVADGSAGTLHDRLSQHAMLKATPILVCVAKKTAEHLTPLKGRSFSGILLGDPDPAILLSKAAEILAANNNGSPYFVPIDGTLVNSELTISMSATVLGRTNEQAVYKSSVEVDSRATLVCVPQDNRISPVILSGGTNIIEGDDAYNLFPLNRIRGKGRRWLSELPNIEVIGKAAVDSDELKSVVFFDPNQGRFEQFRTILMGHNIELLPALTIQEAQVQMESKGASLTCMYLHELQAGPSGINFRKAHSAIPANKRPPIIVGTSSLNSKDSSDCRYIKKPFGLNMLLEMIEACYTKPGQLKDLTESGHELGNVSVNYQAMAQLMGLDEGGGVIQLKFPVIRGSRLLLNHPLLGELWNGDLEVTVAAVMQSYTNPEIWQARVVPRAIGGSKTKYWTKAVKILGDRVQPQADLAAI